MSDDNLESLDNASLRKKCLEFGLPNVPITDTSRKLLIRKLRVAMNGEVDEKKKNRRETIHVSKIPSPIDSNVNANVNSNTDEAPKRPPSRINRRTIAATSVTSTVEDSALPESSTKPEPITERRRSARPPIELVAPAPIIPISQKRKNAEILAEEDDDDDDVILLEAAEQSEKEIVIPRTRRSVSLSKTGVVTTSYSQETVAPPRTINETESESEYDFTSKYANQYEPLTRPLAQTQPLLRETSTSYGLSEPKVVLEPDRTLSFRTTSVNRTSIEPENIYNKTSLPLPSRYSTLGSGYSSNTASSISTTSTTRRYTSGGFGTTTPAKYSSLYNEEEENDENQPQTPYLSDFARKLERLKAEPLTKGVETPRTVPMKRETQRYHSNIVGRRSTMPADSVGDSFRNFIFALDRKYKLKRNLSILFVVLLVLFIYVVFIN